MINNKNKILPPLRGLSIVFIILTNLSAAQNFEVSISGCSDMFKVLTFMRNGAPEDEVSTMLDSVLQTVPYQAMFRHYNRS